MRIQEFKHKKYLREVNKKALTKNTLTFDDYKKFNAVYKYAKKHCIKVNPTQSGAMPNGCYKGHARYMVVKGNQMYELVFTCKAGSYRFIIEPKKLSGNKVSGAKAVRVLYKMMDKYGIDFGKYATAYGKTVKNDIKTPSIKCFCRSFYGKIINHCYHLDLNSSYASRIAEQFPELKPVYEELYRNRKNDNDLFKHVLTNSVGCFQSQYCPDWNDRRRSHPYMFANLSKIAINGTRELVEEYCEKLRKKGMVPVLTNTDGIWYYSDKGPYHDKNEGYSLGQWKTDYYDVKLLMQSVGAYQFMVPGQDKPHTVLRGRCSLDKIKNREDWEFGDIMKINDNVYYDFDEEEGVVIRYE